MSGESVIALLASAGKPVAMPDGSSKITSVLLHRDPVTRARSLAVEFPPGFARVAAGRYQAGEEVVVLAGELLLGTVTLRSGDWAWLPPGLLRRQMSAPSGCTVYAWFSGPAQWTRCEEQQRPGHQPDSGLVHSERLRSESLRGRPRSLRGGSPADEPGRSALVAAGELVSGPAELLSLDDVIWRRLSDGESRAAGPGHTLVRWDSPAAAAPEDARAG